MLEYFRDLILHTKNFYMLLKIEKVLRFETIDN